MERRASNIRNRFVGRVIIGVHDSQFRQAGGKVGRGQAYIMGGKNDKRFGSERALMWVG